MRRVGKTHSPHMLAFFLVFDDASVSGIQCLMTDQYFIWQEREPYPADRKLEQWRLIHDLLRRSPLSITRIEDATEQVPEWTSTLNIRR